MKKRRYDTSSPEWIKYKDWLFQARNHGASKLQLKQIVNNERPQRTLVIDQPYIIDSRGNKVKVLDTAAQATAEDDGYALQLDGDTTILGQVTGNIRDFPSMAFGELADDIVNVDSTKDRINPIHHSDTPETPEEIEAAYQRHKDFFGR